MHDASTTATHSAPRGRGREQSCQSAPRPRSPACRLGERHWVPTPPRGHEGCRQLREHRNDRSETAPAQPPAWDGGPRAQASRESGVKNAIYWVLRLSAAELQQTPFSGGAHPARGSGCCRRGAGSPGWGSPSAAAPTPAPSRAGPNPRHCQPRACTGTGPAPLPLLAPRPGICHWGRTGQRLGQEHAACGARGWGQERARTEKRVEGQSCRTQSSPGHWPLKAVASQHPSLEALL